MSASFVAAPPRPCDVLERHFLTLDDVTQKSLADALGVSRLTVNELLNDKRAITAQMALRLEHVLGADANFWLTLQAEWDLYKARLEMGPAIARLPVLRPKVEAAAIVKPLQRRG